MHMVLVARFGLHSCRSAQCDLLCCFGRCPVLGSKQWRRCVGNGSLMISLGCVDVLLRRRKSNFGKGHVEAVTFGDLDAPWPHFLLT